MALYRRFVLPRLINLAMSNRDVARRRPQVVSQARGDVLEIGVGSGFNLAFYSDRVTKVRGIDPSKELLQMAREKAASVAIPVELLNSSAEDLPLPEETVDSVVMTWTLCSIGDPARALAEMRRVLKPGGDLFFVEHGLAPEPSVRVWQNRLNRIWGAVAGGCNLNRKVDHLISAAGFRILEMDTSYLPGPKIATFMYQGHAQRPVTTE